MTAQPPEVTITPSLGSLGGRRQLLTIDVDVSGYSTGTHILDPDITIVGTVVGGGEAGGSPATIPVTLYVGPVYRAWMPAVFKGF